MTQVEMAAPHLSDRVADAQTILGDRTRSPELPDPDLQLLSKTLKTMTASITRRSAGEQLLHGEPHPKNLLNTNKGPLYIDLETCCRGPVELDLAHAPEEVNEYYPEADADLLRECRILMLAVITTWRWDRHDQLPNGRHLAAGWLSQLRATLD